LYNSIKSFFHDDPLFPPPPYISLITIWFAVCANTLPEKRHITKRILLPYLIEPTPL